MRRRPVRQTARLINAAEKMAEIVRPAKGDISARDTYRYDFGVENERSDAQTIPMPFGW